MVGSDPAGSRPAPNRPFDDQVTAAFCEGCNSSVLHSYRDLPVGEIEVEIEPAADGISLRIMDWGRPLDPAQLSAPLRAGVDLVESGMGLAIIRSFMDD